MSFFEFCVLILWNLATSNVGACFHNCTVCLPTGYSWGACRDYSLVTHTSQSMFACRQILLVPSWMNDGKPTTPWESEWVKRLKYACSGTEIDSLENHYTRYSALVTIAQAETISTLLAPWGVVRRLERSWHWRKRRNNHYRPTMKMRLLHHRHLSRWIVKKQSSKLLCQTSFDAH